MAALLSDLEISRVIMSAEERHGIDTHIVIECVSRENIPDFVSGDETEDMVYWWVEFEDQVKTFGTFAEVEKFLLEDSESSGSKWFDQMGDNV